LSFPRRGSDFVDVLSGSAFAQDRNGLVAFGLGRVRRFANFRVRLRQIFLRFRGVSAEFVVIRLLRLIELVVRRNDVFLRFAQVGKLISDVHHRALARHSDARKKQRGKRACNADLGLARHECVSFMSTTAQMVLRPSPDVAQKNAANESSSSDDPHAAAFSLPSLQKVLVPFLVCHVGRRAQFLIRLHQIILRALRVSGKFAVVGLLRLIDFVVRADDHFLRGAQIPMALADVDHWALRCIRDACENQHRRRSNETKLPFGIHVHLSCV
jgi:hypothetical protein